MQLLKHRYGPFMVCLILAVAGCAAWRQVGANQPLRFSHEKMLHQSVECADCHAETAKGAKAGMPKMETCMDCHEDIDKKKDPDHQIASMFENGVFKAAKITAIPAEVIFSHQKHTVDHKVACNECHKGIEKSNAVSKELRVGMGECIACHTKTAAAIKFAGIPVTTSPTNATVAVATPAAPSTAAHVGLGAEDCATCHTTLRKDAKPPTHAQNWQKFHGQTVKDGEMEGSNKCSLCHTEESCNTCHRTEAPTSHTTLWRQKGHGLAASMDRQSCATCHQSDSCDSCHKTTAPRNHTGQWAGAKDTHCLNCHIGESGDSCSVCHQGNPQGHQKAEPMKNMNPGADCRSCHVGNTRAKMKHVDNGDDCNSCHQKH